MSDDKLTTYVSPSYPAIAREDGLSTIVKTLRETQIKFRELPALKVPRGGSTTWEVETFTGVKPKTSLRVVILSIHPGRAWWASPSKDGESGSPPDCQSIDGVVGLGNCREDQKPEGNGRHYCMDCAWSKFESNRGGGAGQDCQDFRLLFVLEEENLLPCWIKVSATSIKALKEYQLKAVSGGVGYDGVVTEITAEKAGSGSKVYAVLKFRALGALSKEQSAQVKKIGEQVIPMLAPVERDLGFLARHDREKTVDVKGASAATAAGVDRALD